MRKNLAEYLFSVAMIAMPVGVISYFLGFVVVGYLCVLSAFGSLAAIFMLRAGNYHLPSEVSSFPLAFTATSLTAGDPCDIANAIKLFIHADWNRVEYRTDEVTVILSGTLNGESPVFEENSFLVQSGNIVVVLSHSDPHTENLPALPEEDNYPLKPIDEGSRLVLYAYPEYGDGEYAVHVEVDAANVRVLVRGVFED